MVITAFITINLVQKSGSEIHFSHSSGSNIIFILLKICPKNGIKAYNHFWSLYGRFNIRLGEVVPLK